MNNFREDDHPRNPKGEFQNKPGASSASGVKIAPSIPPQYQQAHELLQQAQEIMSHAETVETPRGREVQIPEDYLKEEGFQGSSPDYYYKLENGVDTSITHSRSSSSESGVSAHVDTKNCRSFTGEDSSGRKWSGFSSDGFTAYSSRNENGETSFSMTDGDIDYVRYFGGSASAKAGPDTWLVRDSDDGGIHKRRGNNISKRPLSQEKIDALPANAFQTGYPLNDKIAEARAVLDTGE